MNDTGVVVIPTQRYNKLLDIETRVNVVVERIMHDEDLKTEDILWILGTELAIDKAYEIRIEAEKENEEYLKNAKEARI